MRSLLRPLSVAGLLALVAACTMKSQEAPPFAGPSELDTSIVVAVTPDSLTQDGASQSLITVTARDGNSNPVRNLTLRASMAVGGTPMDFGTLSARSIVTGSDGRATFVYTAPAGAFVSSDDFILVDIIVTPIGSDFNNNRSRTASIRLFPPGIVRPPVDLVPEFTFTPTAPSEQQTVLFDASASTGAIVDYQWNFGDGGRASGRTASHRFTAAGTYIVSLTVADGYGSTQSTSKSVTVGAGTNPTAAFVFSPTNPFPAQDIFFNASASRAGPGRTIASYTWDFGDGGTGSGPTPTHRYALAGGYNVTLVVTDDAGRTGTVTQTVAVGADDPVADFTFAPSAPTAGSPVAFSSTSRAAPGRTIVTSSWVFSGGSPATASGPTASSTFTAGAHNVTLTVVDSAGKIGTVTKQITVTP